MFEKNADLKNSQWNSKEISERGEEIFDIRLKESAEKTASVGDNFGGNSGSNGESVEDAGQESLNRLPPDKSDNFDDPHGAQQ